MISDGGCSQAGTIAWFANRGSRSKLVVRQVAVDPMLASPEVACSAASRPADNPVGRTAARSVGAPREAGHLAIAGVAVRVVWNHAITFIFTRARRT